MPQPAPKAIPAMSLLPEGSVLEKVMLPRYDKERKLSSVLRSEQMTLVTQDQISGKNVSIELFNPDRTRRGRIDLQQAIYDQKRAILTAREPVRMDSPRFTAEGTGLYYAVDKNRGFLVGPVTTQIIELPATAMNPRSPALRATALFGASFLPLLAAPPVNLKPTAEETAALDKEAASQAGKVTEANKATRTDLAATLKASDEANKAVGDFLVQADLLESGQGTPDSVPSDKPLDLKPDPNRTTVNSKGGMYFDTAEGVFVFLKQVVVRDPRFDLDGANELKIFFDKKEVPKAAKEAEKAGAKQGAPAEAPPATPDAGKADGQPKKDKKNSLDFGGGANVGDPRKLVATGAVHLLQKGGEGKEPIEASAAFFSYDIVTGDIILRGGYPWVRQGKNYQRAMEPNLGIRLDKNYNFVAEPGTWTFDITVDPTKKDKPAGEPATPKR